MLELTRFAHTLAIAISCVVWASRSNLCSAVREVTRTIPILGRMKLAAVVGATIAGVTPWPRYTGSSCHPADVSGGFDGAPDIPP